jgi:hypothetical protein
LTFTFLPRNNGFNNGAKLYSTSKRQQNRIAIGKRDTQLNVLSVSATTWQPLPELSGRLPLLDGKRLAPCNAYTFAKVAGSALI